jgi:hypothetical protein
VRRPLRVLELGSYVSVAYAGMILAEQGHQVTKWINPDPTKVGDPILGLRGGLALWRWINHGKTTVGRDVREVEELQAGQWDVVLDNVRLATWWRWGIDPAAVAERAGVVWVSLRADDAAPESRRWDPEARSFDALAQARAWGDHIGYVPAYLGDTSAGLWLAFKALAAPVGHHVVYQATALAKLVEGEGVVTPARNGSSTPWDEPGTYGRDPDRPGGGVRVLYRGETYTEPFRGEEWRREHLRHQDGRYVI